MADDGSTASIKLASAGLTDTGRTRDHNEDTILLRPESHLFAVCDGMGGHAAGDVASRVAAEALAAYHESDGGAAPPDDHERTEGARRLRAAVFSANDAVVEAGGGAALAGKMGSTVVAIHVDIEGRSVHFCHAGDARCYRIRRGTITQMTRDHSMINDALALNPNIPEEILAALPTNVITRGLGMAVTVDADTRTEALHTGDTYLLCSDGLSGELSDERMLAIIEEADDNEAACQQLIDEANDAGGGDNISAVLVTIDGPESLAAPEEVAISEMPEEEAGPASEAAPSDDPSLPEPSLREPEPIAQRVSLPTPLPGLISDPGDLAPQSSDPSLPEPSLPEPSSGDALDASPSLEALGEIPPLDGGLDDIPPLDGGLDDIPPLDGGLDDIPPLDGGLGAGPSGLPPLSGDADPLSSDLEDLPPLSQHPPSSGSPGAAVPTLPPLATGSVFEEHDDDEPPTGEHDVEDDDELPTGEHAVESDDDEPPTGQRDAEGAGDDADDSDDADDPDDPPTAERQVSEAPRDEADAVSEAPPPPRSRPEMKTPLWGGVGLVKAAVDPRFTPESEHGPASSSAPPMSSAPPLSSAPPPHSQPVVEATDSGRSASSEPPTSQ